MTRRCELTGKSVRSGNKVSKSNRKVRRKFRPSLREHGGGLQPEEWGRRRPRLCSRALRTLTRYGGLKAYLTSKSAAKLRKLGLSERLLRVRKRLCKEGNLAKNQASQLEGMVL